MPKKQAFPQTLVVKREEDRDGSVYYAASKTANEHAEVGEEIQVAIYKLIRVTTVSADPVVK